MGQIAYLRAIAAKKRQDGEMSWLQWMHIRFLLWSAERWYHGDMMKKAARSSNVRP